MATATKLHLRSPLHHPSLAPRATDGPPSPASRGRIKRSRPARTLACGPPNLSHVKREAGANRAGKRWWPRCLCWLFRFAKRRKMERRKTQGTLRTLGCGAVPRGTARLPAFHHGSSQGVCGPLVRSGPGFVGRPSKGRGSLRRRSTHFSDAPRMPVVMPADMMPGPPGSGLQARPRAPPLAPPPQFASAAASFTGEMIRGHM
jgi:hypothetical protein